ncbi:hypothetical protein UACE39S_00329 [Ureibacillus acetophenoni]
MSLNGETKKVIQKFFDETMEILDKMEFNDSTNKEEEALFYADWILTKAKLRYGEVNNGTYVERQIPSFPMVVWGIYWAYLGVNVGSEEDEHRPVILLRADGKSDVCTIIPLSTQVLNDGYWYHVDLDGYDNTALVEQMRVISKKRLDYPLRVSGKIAEVSPKNMKEIYRQIENRHASIPPFKRPLLDSVE